MSLLLLGTSFRIASADWRGRLAFAPAEAGLWLGAAAGEPGVEELLLLSTCNRSEIYAIGADDEVSEAVVRRAVVAARGGDWLAPGPHRYRLTGEAAAQHLCRVACGLDSLMLGEPEILGQVRDAAVAAREAGTLGPRLDALVRAAVAAGRRARSATRIGVGATSAAAAAVTLAERASGGLSGRRVVVIGAGQAGRLAVSRVAKRRPSSMAVANRTIEAGRAAAGLAAGVTAHGLEAVPALLASADVVIAAVGVPEPVVSRASLEVAMHGRAHRPLVVVDLGVPPAVDPAAATLPGLTLHGVDDLRTVLDRTVADRQREAPHVEAIAAAEASGVVEAWRAAGPGAGDRQRLRRPHRPAPSDSVLSRVLSHRAPSSSPA